MSDIEAIQRLKSGDIGGLETLVIRYQAKATKTAFLILHDQHLAEDVVQETFVTLYRHIRSFDPARPFEPYLMRSVVNAALNMIKHEASLAQQNESDGMRCLESLISQAATVEDQTISMEMGEELLRALAQLPPRQRAVIVQRYYLEMSEKEMAEKMDAPPGTIKWLLNQARIRLRLLLHQEGAGNE